MKNRLINETLYKTTFNPEWLTQVTLKLSQNMTITKQSMLKQLRVINSQDSKEVEYPNVIQMAEDLIR